MEEWVLVRHADSGSSLAMQEWLVNVVIRHAGDWSGYTSMQEWLVVRHAGVARRWPCRSGWSLAM